MEEDKEESIENEVTEEKDMTPILIKDLGMEYPTKNSSRKYHYGIFKCQYCGNEFKTQLSYVKNGATRSCGCIIGKHKIVHNLSRHRFYKTWMHMLDRCSNPNCKDYKYYGGRGISVCEEWYNVRKFVEWAEETHIEGYTLDRIDNDKGYSTDNCRWADGTTQNTNRRRQKNNTSGYVGVHKRKDVNKWKATVSINGKQKNLGLFEDKMEAVKARDDYIKEHSLPNKLSAEYEKETYDKD